MKKLLISMVALLCTCPAQAENWVRYGGNDYFHAAIDVDTIAATDNGATFWTKWDLSPKGTSTMFAKNKKLRGKVLAMKMKWRASCGDQKKRAEELASYTFDRKGNMLDSVSHTMPVTYDIVPGTLMEEMHSAICSVVAGIKQEKEEQERKKQEAEREARRVEEEKQRREIEAKEGLVVGNGFIRFNGQVILTDKLASKIINTKDYSLDNRRVYLIRFEYEDSDCNTRYQFITQELDGSVVASERFGDCRKSNGIRRIDNRLLVGFGERNKPKQTWEYQNGQVVKAEDENQQNVSQPSVGRKAAKKVRSMFGL